MTTLKSKSIYASQLILYDIWYVACPNSIGLLDMVWYTRAFRKFAEKTKFLLIRLYLKEQNFSPLNSSIFTITVNRRHYYTYPLKNVHFFHRFERRRILTKKYQCLQQPLGHWHLHISPAKCFPLMVFSRQSKGESHLAPDQANTEGAGAESIPVCGRALSC